MDNVFTLNPSAPNQMIMSALYEKATQAKALVECILLAIMSKEIKLDLLYDAVWGIDSYLSQIKLLQEHLEKASDFNAA